ncbi:MAG: dehydratase, partial [Comamonas sp.]|nr:dehydratase [Comamonas sp.]
VLHVESEVVEIIPSQSKPNRAMVRMLCQTKNQHGEVLQRFRPKMVCFKKPGA